MDFAIDPGVSYNFFHSGMKTRGSPVGPHPSQLACAVGGVACKLNKTSWQTCWSYLVFEIPGLGEPKKTPNKAVMFPWRLRIHGVLGPLCPQLRCYPSNSSSMVWASMGPSVSFPPWRHIPFWYVLMWHSTKLDSLSRLCCKAFFATALISNLEDMDLTCDGLQVIARFTGHNLSSNFLNHFAVFWGTTNFCKQLLFKAVAVEQLPRSTVGDPDFSSSSSTSWSVPRSPSSEVAPSALRKERLRPSVETSDALGSRPKDLAVNVQDQFLLFSQIFWKGKKQENSWTAYVSTETMFILRCFQVSFSSFTSPQMARSQFFNVWWSPGATSSRRASSPAPRASWTRAGPSVRPAPAEPNFSLGSCISSQPEWNPLQCFWQHFQTFHQKERSKKNIWCHLMSLSKFNGHFDASCDWVFVAVSQGLWLRCVHLELSVFKLDLELCRWHRWVMGEAANIEPCGLVDHCCLHIYRSKHAKNAVDIWMFHLLLLLSGYRNELVWVHSITVHSITVTPPRKF